jgi:predicted aldo/keto reductase-like oxidoreductase
MQVEEDVFVSLMNISSVQQMKGPYVQANHYCLECSKEIEIPVTFLGVETKFCEECEIDDYEGKCNKVRLKDVGQVRQPMQVKEDVSIRVLRRNKRK